jgi:CheY-like chemotaxis protein
VNCNSTNGAAAYVLYVEDEESDRMFMELAFRKAGMDEALRMVVDGREAMAYLGGSGDYADRGRHPMPAVVLLDLNLPLASGFEVLRWMKGHPELASLPVVMFTSSARETDKATAVELGAKEYLVKPQLMGGFVEVARGLREKWLGAASAGN